MAFEKNMVSTLSLPHNETLREYLMKNLAVDTAEGDTPTAGQTLDPGKSMLRLVTSREHGNGK